MLQLARRQRVASAVSAPAALQKWHNMIGASKIWAPNPVTRSVPRMEPAEAPVPPSPTHHRPSLSSHSLTHSSQFGAINSSPRTSTAANAVAAAAAAIPVPADIPASMVAAGIRPFSSATKLKPSEPSTPPPPSSLPSAPATPSTQPPPQPTARAPRAAPSPSAAPSASNPAQSPAHSQTAPADTSAKLRAPEEEEDGDDGFEEAEERMSASVSHRGGVAVSAEVRNSRFPAKFGGLTLSTALVAALNSTGITKPSEIQQLVIPEIMAGRDVIFAAQTGTGKTLAYVLPIIENLVRDEKDRNINTRSNRPRAMILVPTRELAVQVLSVCKTLSHFMQFRALSVAGDRNPSVQHRALELGVDLVVGTPGRVLELMKSHNLVPSDVRYLAVDEADTMFEHATGFAPLIRQILTAIHSRTPRPNRTLQCVLASASLQPHVLAGVQREFPRATYIATRGLHRTAPTLDELFVVVRGDQNKLDVLLKVLRKEALQSVNGTRGQKAVQSVHEPAASEFETTDTDDPPSDVGESVSKAARGAAALRARTQAVDEHEEEDELEEAAVAKSGARGTNQAYDEDEEEEQDPDDYQEEMAAASRMSAKEEAKSKGTASGPSIEPTLVFCNTVDSVRAVEHFLREHGFRTTTYHASMPPKTRTANFATFMRSEVPIMVCTDIAARGLDTRFVQHVVLFDFPLNSIDYLHRVGRTARFGSGGRSTALVTKGDAVLAEGIRRARAAGTTIHTLSADKRDVPVQLNRRTKHAISRKRAGQTAPSESRASSRTRSDDNSGKSRPNKNKASHSSSDESDDTLFRRPPPPKNKGRPAGLRHARSYSTLARDPQPTARALPPRSARSITSTVSSSARAPASATGSSTASRTFTFAAPTPSAPSAGAPAAGAAPGRLYSQTSALAAARARWRSHNQQLHQSASCPLPDPTLSPMPVSSPSPVGPSTPSPLSPARHPAPPQTLSPHLSAPTRNPAPSPSASSGSTTPAAPLIAPGSAYQAPPQSGKEMVCGVQLSNASAYVTSSYRTASLYSSVSEHTPSADAPSRRASLQPSPPPSPSAIASGFPLRHSQSSAALYGPRTLFTPHSFTAQPSHSARRSSWLAPSYQRSAAVSASPVAATSSQSLPPPLVAQTPPPRVHVPRVPDEFSAQPVAQSSDFASSGPRNPRVRPAPTPQQQARQRDFFVSLP